MMPYACSLDSTANNWMFWFWDGGGRTPSVDSRESGTANMTPQTDLSAWPSKAQAAERLGIGERTLDRMIARKHCIEMRMRPRADGRKPEVVCNPEDVQRVISERYPQLGPELGPAVLRAKAALAPYWPASTMRT